MSQPTTPRPITREEFEAGEEFQLVDPLDGIFMYECIKFTGSRIMKSDFTSSKKRLYCAVYTVEPDGFRFIDYRFNHKFVEKVYFKDCFISE